MYAYISGKVAHKEAALAIIECGGIGYEIHISLPAYSALELDKDCKLYTYLHVKEDAHTLYGFVDEGEKKLFLHLISVSGVGPNTALVMLSSLSAAELREAIVIENTRVLQAIKGIGAKTAQRIILELKDKLKKENLLGAAVSVQPGRPLSPMIKAGQTRQEALTALTKLGIAQAVAEKTLEAVILKYGETLSVEELIKYALKNG